MEVSDIEINGVALNFSSPKVFLDRCAPSADLVATHSLTLSGSAGPTKSCCQQPLTMRFTLRFPAPSTAPTTLALSTLARKSRGSPATANSHLSTLVPSTNVSLAFTINGTSFAMKSETFSAGTNAEGKYCAGAVTDGGDNWILGATFSEYLCPRTVTNIPDTPCTVMSYYSVFRFDPPSIGLAPIADPGNTLESASIKIGRAHV